MPPVKGKPVANPSWAAVAAQVVVPKPGPKPLWAGPQDAGLNGGITFSMLSRFLQCRERFRVSYIEGLRPAEGFDHKIEYGQMWHTCEEALADASPDGTVWQDRLLDYCRRLCRRYPLSQEKIDHWYNVCKVQFPLYVDYWCQHPDIVARQPLLAEQVFNVPVQLPSGRTVYLRGKMDSVDLVTGDGPNNGVWLMENKTKGDIHEEKMRRQLKNDLQTMMYLAALSRMMLPTTAKLKGVRYNVVRRPLSGGKGTIVRHKAKGNTPEETKEHFYGRLRDIIAEDADTYFMRWNVDVAPRDIETFERRTLVPVLEQLCDWYEFVTHCLDHGVSPFTPLYDTPGYSLMTARPNAVHWEHPAGVRNWMDEGGETDLDEYLRSGSAVGLVRRERLFEELT